MKGVDYFLRKVAEEEAAPGESAEVPPQLSQGGKHLWGWLSYFFSTVIGVNLFHALTADGTVNLGATILGSGFLGLVGLGLIVYTKLWEPSFKRK
ncbi:MAG: hypothetical protein IT342_21875 [Candidatus Melainabacteria bacterium]|nr:hypothetical protein [Candidatus Melainabacteria bacterium]